jgi:membrane fusion protein (multidrug efflux system)
MTDNREISMKNMKALRQKSLFPFSLTIFHRTLLSFFSFFFFLAPLFFLFFTSIFLPGISFAKSHPPTPMPIVVSTAPVELKNIPKIINAYGHMDAVNQVDLSFETGGKIKKVLITSGRVKKNDLIMTLSDDADQAKLQALQATLTLDKSNNDRAAALKAYGGISAAALEADQAKVDEDQANVDQQQALINQKSLTAPFDGVLGDMKFSVGAYVTSGEPVVNLVQEAPLKVRYSVPSNQKPDLEIGQTVKVIIHNKTYGGLVNFISPEVDMNTGTLTIEAQIDNPDYALIPGQFVNVEQILDPNQKLLVAPSVSLMTDILGQYVYKIDSSKPLNKPDSSPQFIAEKIYVSTGVIFNNVIQITQGLQAGDQVIIAGQQKVEDGDVVEVRN